jgi:predicted SAM-dependent methyltransferase
MKLNLGCGPQVPAGWINVDYAFGARLAAKPLFRSVNKRLKLFAVDWNDSIFIHNLTERFPWRDGTVHTVYSSHTLEHLSRQEGLFFLRESQRVLKPGGIIRIVVPDLVAFVNSYVKGDIRADSFVESLGVLYKK